MAVVALAACTWVLGTALVGVTDAVAYLAPALLLSRSVASGRYPGERTYAAGSPAAAPRSPASHGPPGATPMPAARLPRGGVLLAAGLAGRAPPPAVL